MSVIYEESIVAFIDILGFSSMVKDEAIAELLLNVLSLTKRNENDLAVSEVIDMGGGSFNLSVFPKISAFSDCIVLSLSEKHLRRREGLTPEIAWQNLILSIINIIQDYAYRLAVRGLLIRGGMTIGPLHHEKGVVFGQALVDAYLLEHKKADVPRILVTSEVINRFNLTKNYSDDIEYFKKDVDGMDYLNIANIWSRAIGFKKEDILLNFDNEFNDIKNKRSRYSEESPDEHKKILGKWTWFRDNVISNLKSK